MRSRLHTSLPIELVLLFLAITLVGSSPVVASPLGGGIAQPATYASMDGAYRLRVVPEDRRGNGGALYELSHGGEVVWSDRREYTLRAVEVTTEGNAVGIAYRRTEPDEQTENQRRETFFEIVILHRDGTELLRNSSKQYEVHHSSRQPHAVALHTSEESDSVLIRIAGVQDSCDRYRGPQSWWQAHRLSDGTEIARVDPRTKIEGLDQWWNILQSQDVPGTPLVLSQWFTFGGREFEASERAGLIALTHHDGTPVWTLEVGSDYESIDLSKTVYRGLMETHFKEHPAMAVPGTYREFHVKEDGGDRMTAMRVVEEGGEWSVERIGPVDVAAIEVADEENSLEELPLIERFTLGARRGAAGKYGRIRNFYFDADGNIHQHMITADSRHKMRKIDTDTGQVLSEWLLPASEGRTYLGFDLGGGRYSDRFLVSRQSSEDPAEFSAEWLELRTGERSEADAVFRVYPRRIALAANGDVVLPTRDGLHRFRPSGEVVWSRGQEERSDYPYMIEPSAATFLLDGSLAILCAKHVLILDGGTGEVVRTIDLRELLDPDDKRRPLGYIGEIVGHPGGGFVLNVSGTPSLIASISTEGELRSARSPKYEDGRTFSIAGCVRVAPDGKVWTTDGESFLRLSADGVVDRSLSGRSSTNTLGELAGFTVGPDARWYAVEKGSGRVFIYEPTGDVVGVREPLPDSYVGSVDEAAIVVAKNGNIYVERPSTIAYLPPDEYLVFPADGSAPEKITFSTRLNGGTFIGSCWDFQPGTSRRCGFNGSELVIGASEENPIRVDKRANGFWLSMIAFDIGPDGSFAVLNNEHDFQSDGYTLDLFTEKGTPVRTIPVPATDERFREIVYDGERAILVGPRVVGVMTLPEGDVEFRRLPDVDIERPRWAAYFVAGGTELLLLERGSHEFFRIGLPQP